MDPLSIIASTIAIGGATRDFVRIVYNIAKAPKALVNIAKKVEQFNKASQISPSNMCSMSVQASLMSSGLSPDQPCHFTFT